MSLTEYKRKRHFEKTTEPIDEVSKKSRNNDLIFVIQKHHASHLHFDFRLEMDGVLKSWAVPKGISEKENEKRLAVEVEDHPLDYATFEGIIPKGEYGAGKVEIWDYGIWKTNTDPQKQLKKGHLEIELVGKRLLGKWRLIRTNMKAKKANWLLIKHSEIPLKHSKRKSTKRVSLNKIPRTKMPEFIEPQLCTLSSSAPNGDDWIHEIKLDGYRTLSRKEDKNIEMLTRSGIDWSKKYPEIAKQCQKIKAKAFLIDGEIVSLNEKGISQFSTLQISLQNNNSDKLVFCVFDLLFLNGKDLRDLPLLQRKNLLQKLLEESKLDKIIFHPHQFVDGPSLYHSACQLGLEGIISKKSEDTYSSGRSSSWLKVKCLQQKNFIICGYSVQKNQSQLGALILGQQDDVGNLQYVGRVGTGLNQINLLALNKKLKILAAKTSPFATKVPDTKDVNWVQPQLIASVEFATWTSEKMLRHAVFKNLVNDHPTETMHLTHPEKIIFPKDQITKLEIVNYYKSIQKLILPHIKNRPLSLLRCPDGQGKNCFFQKHLDKSDSDISVVKIDELLKIIQINALELHAWNCLISKKDNPVLIIFDLDPDPSVSWKSVKLAALRLKNLLKQLGLKSYLKVSGNKGLHLHVPILPKYSWDEVKNFSKSVCLQLVDSNPNDYTVNIMKKNRKKKIFLDYLRNGYGATAICAFSIRNHPSATIALPIHWDKLAGLKGPDLFTLKNWNKSLHRTFKDPWEDYFKIKQTIRILDAARKNGGIHET